jgi:hypothetical protein
MTHKIALAFEYELTMTEDQSRAPSPRTSSLLETKLGRHVCRAVSPCADSHPDQSSLRGK